MERYLAAALVAMLLGFGAILLARSNSERTPKRRRTFLAAGATLLVVSLVLGLVGLFAPPRPSSGSGTPPEVTTPPWALPAGDYPAGALPPGETLPAFEVEGWLNGSPPAREAAGHRVTVVDLWSFWYVSSQAMVPGLLVLHEKYKDCGVAFVSVTNMPREGVQGVVTHFAIPWPCGYEAKSQTLARCGAYNFPNPRRGYEVKPTLYLVGADRRIIWNDGHARLKANMDAFSLLRQLDERIAEALSAPPK